MVVRDVGTLTTYADRTDAINWLQVLVQNVPITQVRVTGDLYLPSYPHHPRLSGTKARGLSPVEEGLRLADLSTQLKHSHRRHLQLPRLKSTEELWTN